jgi:hypothetical protein
MEGCFSASVVHSTSVSSKIHRRIVEGEGLKVRARAGRQGQASAAPSSSDTA